MAAGLLVLALAAVAGGLAASGLGSGAPARGHRTAAPPVPVPTSAAPTTTTAPPASTAPVTTVTSAPTTTTTTTVPVPQSGQGVTAIGDSIMIDITPDLEQLLPGITIDGLVGQQLYQVLAEAPQLKASGQVGSRLILELGTNGPYSVTQLQDLLDDLGPFARVVLVNTREDRPWEQAVNQTIAAVAQSYPNATLVDWYDASADDPQYFEPDGVHLDPAGAQAMASMVVQALESPPTPAAPIPPAAAAG